MVGKGASSIHHYELPVLFSPTQANQGIYSLSALLCEYGPGQQDSALGIQ